MLKKSIFVSLAIFLITSYCFSKPPDTIDNPAYIIYIPSDIDYNQQYPLVIALSPYASAQSMVNTWEGAAEKYKWIIFASKEFRNGIDMNAVFPHIVAILKDAFVKYPIDKSRIIATGFSGGGMGSHAFIFSYPELISAIVINTGMMHGYYREQKDMYPRGKIAVFLSSPNDFRYKEMERDRIFLESLGWKTKWIEFQGGHTIAPESSYGEAAEWLNKQLKQ